MSTTESVKEGDKFLLTFTVSLDLTGSTVRLLARNRETRDVSPTVLDSTVAHAANGLVTHQLDGTLTVGNYYIELEATQGNGNIITFPGDGFLTLRVTPDLDQ